MCLDNYWRLARTIDTPPMFADVLPLMVQPNEVELLLAVSDNELSIADLARALSLPHATVEFHINDLYARGFLDKKRNDEAHYSVRSFRSIISRYVSEGRGNALGEYAVALAGYRIEEHAKRARADPFPEAKVLPIPEAVTEPVSVILPYDTAVGILEKAMSLSVRDCECRVTYRKCGSPLRTCLAVNQFSDELIERKVAEEISLQEAKKVLQTANEHGLVHQALYTDWLKGEVFDVCSCCPCCCTYLRTLMNYGVKHHIAKSGLTAKVDSDKCIGCGICLERCVFQARGLENGKSVIIQGDCYGCGLCTSTCPTGASKLVETISLHERQDVPREVGSCRERLETWRDGIHLEHRIPLSQFESSDHTGALYRDRHRIS